MGGETLTQPGAGPNQWPSQTPCPTMGRVNGSLGHWLGQKTHSAIGWVKWLTRPLDSSLGQWPSEPLSHQGSSLGHWPSEPSSRPCSSLGHWPSEPSSSSLGQWPSEPQLAPRFSLGQWPSEPHHHVHSAIGRPSHSMAEPSKFTRPRGLQTTPWLPINTRVFPLTQVIHS